MRVVLDTNALIFLLDKRAPKDIQDRLKGLLQGVDDTKGQVIIPAQVVAEYLSKAGDAGHALLEVLLRAQSVRIGAFDHIAAVECAVMTADALATGDKRLPLGRGVAWQKVKIDRQIVAIAKARQATIVADDQDIHDIGNAASVKVTRVKDLPLPTWAMQMQLVEVEEPRVAPIEPVTGRVVQLSTKSAVRGAE